MTDPHRNAPAQAIYRAMLRAQRDEGDAALCEALDLLAADTGQNKFRHAASVLRGIRLGRHAIDDKNAIRRIEAFPAGRRREAAGIVARQIAGAGASDALVVTIAQRLRRKLRTNETNKIGPFAAKAS